MDLALLENRDYIYDMKVNHGYTNETLAILFNISVTTIKRRVSVHKIPTVGISRKLNESKLDLNAPILSFSRNTITKSEVLSKRLHDETIILNVYPNVNNSHRYYFLKNGMTTIPKCVRCNNPTSLNNTYQKKVFQQYCSHLCNSTSSKLPKESSDLLSNYDWLYEKRIIENLSYENIAKLSNVSYVAVLAWIKKHGFDDVKYQWNSNKSLEEIDKIKIKRRLSVHNTVYGEETTKLLHNYDFLFDQYITQRKPCTQIAKLLGVEVCIIRKLLLEYKIVTDFNRRYFNTISSEEIEMYEFIKSVYPTAIHSYRRFYHAKELDIYIKEMKLGFEYNGCYAHSEDRRDKYYHEKKVAYFNMQGIRVVQIWGDDWNFHKDKVKNMILTRLGLIKKTIHARKCIVKEITQNIYSEFLETNHILGKEYAGVRLGLFNNDNLVAVMGFKDIANNSKRTGVDLTRFSTLDVHGSFSKLLSYYRKLNINVIINSIADLEIVDRYNNVYLNNGFLETHHIKVDYQYYVNKLKKRVHKSNFRKKAFKSMGYNIENKTETMLANEAKLLRCYDSGKINYVLYPK